MSFAIACTVRSRLREQLPTQHCCDPHCRAELPLLLPFLCQSGGNTLVKETIHDITIQYPKMEQALQPVAEEQQDKIYCELMILNRLFKNSQAVLVRTSGPV